MEDIFKLVNQVETVKVVRAFLPKLTITADGNDRFKALCPLHHENTPSFKIFKTNWRCFGCGEGSTNVDLLLKADLASSALEAAKAIGKEFSISFKDETKSQKAPSLAEYAQYLGIPLKFLTENFFLEESTTGIRIPFVDENEELTGVQIRHRLEKGKRDLAQAAGQLDAYLKAKSEEPSIRTIKKVV